MRPPFNQPTVLGLAQLEPTRIIPAEHVQQLERAAARVASAGQRVSEAEAQCLAELDKTSHAAWQRGYAQGHAEGLRKLRDFVAAVDARRKSLDAELISLAMDAVRKILRHVPSDLLTENLIETALGEAQDERGRLVLRVHPGRIDAAERFLSQCPATAGLRVIVEGDASMGEHDCMLETSFGVIDTSLEAQLDTLDAVLRESSASDTPRQ
jgi:type III secretion system HrpE/YscL family protein